MSEQSRIRVAVNGYGVIGKRVADLGRSHDDLYEVALWADVMKVEDDELFYAYMVDNQAIAIPDTIDAIRALSGLESDAARSIAATDSSLGNGTIAEALGRPRY